MNIICSAGKGEMSAEDCLTCARTGDQLCGYDYIILRTMYANNSSASRRGEIHVTDLTGCMRKSWYDKSAPEAERPHETFARSVGTMIHGAIEGSDQWVESELRVEVEGIVGRADIVYYDGRLVDLKTTRWLYTSKVPYGSHAIQVNLYAYALKQMGRPVSRLQIQYLDMSGPTKCRKCRVPVQMFDGEIKCPVCFQYVKGAHLGAYLVDVPMMPEAEIKQLFEDRRDTLQNAIDMGMPPEMEPGFLCAYCSHQNTTCFPMLTEE